MDNQDFMTEQQQKLYDKLLKKVNEYCLGAAAEDVIAAIDALVENYERHLHPNKDPNKVARELLKDLTPLQTLKQLRTDFYNYGPVKYDSISYFTRIENSLKALEIIKSKKVSVDYLFSREVNDYIDYNVWSGCENLTAEEYEFLKEILK